MKTTALLTLLLGFAVGCGGTGEERVGAQAEACSSAIDHIVTIEHLVPVSSGATLHVVEKRARTGSPDHERALLMLPATLVTNIMWNADVPGRPEFNGLERAARAGFRAYTLDYEGYGASSKPADGKDVTAARLTQDAADLVRWIRSHSHASKVDLLGSSLGSSIALTLGGLDSPLPRGWIGHVVLTANVYKSVSPFMANAFFTPQTLAFFQGVPNGYIPTDLSVYGLVVWASDPAAQLYCYQNCPGVYAVGPTLAGFQLPLVDASRGRAPMLQFWGTNDMISPLSDAQQLQAEYGGPHALVVLEGGSHVPQWESVRDQFWANTFAFLDDDGDGDDE